MHNIKGDDLMSIHKAIEFAAIAHKTDKRKGTDIPYIVHPFEVAQILTANGANENVICAGLLHDTVEDTDITIKDIERNFGQDIANIVAANSEDKSLSWERRKEHTVEYIKNDALLEVMLVCCADKLSNLRSVKHDLEIIGDNVWERFNRGFEQQKWYYKGLCEAMGALSDYDMYNEFCETYKEIFE